MELIQSLLAADPAKRCTVQGLLDSAWIGTSKEQLEEMYRLRFYKCV